MITIRHESEDGLTIRTWRFGYIYHQHTVVLSEYVVHRRETKRHRFREAGKWERALNGRATVAKPKIEQEMLDDVRQQVVTMLAETLKVEP